MSLILVILFLLIVTGLSVIRLGKVVLLLNLFLHLALKHIELVKIGRLRLLQLQRHTVSASLVKNRHLLLHHVITLWDRIFLTVDSH